MIACATSSRRAVQMKTIAILALFFLAPVAIRTISAQSIPYQRPVDTAPQEHSIGGGYKTPAVQKPRSRKALVALAIGSVAYFGFYREGCVCPIGSIQNVAVALMDPRYSIPMVVTATFFLPLVMAVFFGRAFCGGVCALGAIQELVLIKPVQVPRRLDRALGLLKYVYLGLALFFALKPAAARDFVICRFDPFVGFFRRSGAPHMLLIGGAFLVAGMFIGRPYCRYLCPYGGLLAWCTRLARRGVTITPDKELDCGLCTEACPYGAIEKMRAVRRNCLYCARCYAACPRDGELARAKAQLVQLS